jgi:hypothetical protein
LPAISAVGDRRYRVLQEPLMFGQPIEIEIGTGIDPDTDPDPEGKP